METTYNLFQVHDYKGGELNTEINLTKEQLIQELALAFFENLYEAKDIPNVQIEIEQDIIKFIKEEFSIYAGGGRYVAEIYKNLNGKLIEVDIEKFTRPLSKYIHTEWRETLV